jgi:hypothetical protein
MPVNNEEAVVQNSIKRKMIGKYFALMRDWNYKALQAKEMAKSKFGLEHFDDITEEQLGILLKGLEHD